MGCEVETTSNWPVNFWRREETHSYSKFRMLCGYVRWLFVTRTEIVHVFCHFTTVQYIFTEGFVKFYLLNLSSGEVTWVDHQPVLIKPLWSFSYGNVSNLNWRSIICQLWHTCEKISVTKWQPSRQSCEILLLFMKLVFYHDSLGLGGIFL